MRVYTKKGRAEKFFADVVATFVSDECLIWPFYRDEDGYGKLKGKYVHRLACELENGHPPSPDHQAAHNCGNGHIGCCNKKHMRWATAKENHSDKLIHGTSARGERQGSSKLSESDVLEIVSLKGIMTQKQIAVRFGVGKSQIGNIHLGIKWAWLTGIEHDNDNQKGHMEVDLQDSRDRRRG